MERRHRGNGPSPKTDPATSRRLGKIRQADTVPELVVRSALYKAGLRYRIGNRDLPGSPDIANRLGKWAVFVHGCFWHAHARCKRATVPKRNRDFWVHKFRENRKRDSRAIQALSARGFFTVVIWECELGAPARLFRKLVKSLRASKHR